MIKIKGEGGGGRRLLTLIDRSIHNTDESFCLTTGRHVLHSNYECEILGLYATFQLVKNSTPGKFRRFNIFTDNQGVILRTMNLQVAKPGQYLFKELFKL